MLTSKDIKAAFASHGIKVRVKSFGAKAFRICTVDGSAHGEASQTAAASLKMTGAHGLPGGIINQEHEMFSYAEGRFIRR